MKTDRGEFDHFVTLIIAQNTWREKDLKRIEGDTFANYLAVNRHSDCHVCLTCPICRSTWALFDPFHPGEYNRVCPICEQLMKKLKEVQGKNDGLMLFSHGIFQTDEMRKFAEYILQDDKIKKIYLYKLSFHRRIVDFFDDLKELRLKESQFLQLLDHDQFELNTLYEIAKDRYY